MGNSDRVTSTPAATHRLPGRAGSQLPHRLQARLPRLGGRCPARRSRTSSPRSRAVTPSCAMIPIDNSIAGRVADIHHFLPDSDLHIIGEHFLRIQFALMALPGADLATHQDRAQPRARARPVPQGDPRARPASGHLRRHRRRRPRGRRGRRPDPWPRSRRRWRPRPTASRSWPRTSRTRSTTPPGSSSSPASTSRRPLGNGPVVTSFIFNVRNLPAALYKALGGFATNGVNMTKLESYMVGGHFTATQFLAEVDGHPAGPAAVPSPGGAGLLHHRREDPRRLPGRLVPVCVIARRFVPDSGLVRTREIPPCQDL